MKRYLISLLFLFSLVADCIGQQEAKLAILSTPKTATAADLLMVEFSSKQGVALLERSEIERIYREQSLSATSSRDVLKVGKLLGADGVIFLEQATEGTNQTVAARLVAVKPGVVLSFAETPWPLQVPTEWTAVIAKRFEPLLPKLAVPTKDALPISILNLRSAANTTESRTTERELTLLLINRLMQEREFFVLERRRMEVLGQEKELSGTEEAPFWNGAYLLEGAIDKEGFSRSEITIHARFSPPNQGTPTDIKVSGPRNNLTSVVSKLAAEILESLKRQSSASDWKPEEEALRYFEEATWALKWGMWKEAQAAAESSWALGKRDMECALARTKAYVAEVPPDSGRYQKGEMHFGIGTHDDLEPSIRKEQAKHSDRVTFKRNALEKNGYKSVQYVVVPNRPDPKDIAQAQHALELYYNFSRTLPSDEPKNGSPWYLLGLETLEASSLVLQHFHFVPSARKGVEEELRTLRATTRTVADWIGKSLSVQQTYFVGDRVANNDELYNTVYSGKTFYRTKAEWGSFWQETPEDCISLFRELASSPAFTYLHGTIWLRGLERPFLVSWTGEKANEELWHRFVQELIGSTNVVQRLTGRYMAFHAAETDEEVEKTYNAIREFPTKERTAILAQNVELFPTSYMTSLLFETKENYAVRDRFFKEVWPQMNEINNEHRELLKARQKLASDADLFEKQKLFLKQLEPYDFFKFTDVFRHLNYNGEQARELRPLLVAYHTNLVAELQKTKNIKLHSGISRVTGMISRLDKVINPSSASSAPQTATINQNVIKPPTKPVVTIQQLPAPVSPTVPQRSTTTAEEAIIVNTFHKIPHQLFSVQKVSELTVFAHRYRDGKLWLDLRFSATDPRHNVTPHRGALASIDPDTGQWGAVVEYPQRGWNESGIVGFMGETETGLHFEVFQSALYISEHRGLRKFDFGKKKWETLNVPIQELGQLFVVHDRLFFASPTSIIELLEKGQTTRVLASTRRRPSASSLDALATLGSPAVVPGPDKSIRAFVNQQLFTWKDADWVAGEKLTATRVRHQEGLTLFSAPAAQLWSLGADETTATLCINTPPRHDQHMPVMAMMHMKGLRTSSTTPSIWDASDTYWQEVSGQKLGDDLFFYKEHSDLQNIAGKWEIIERDGRHGELQCFVKGRKRPLIVPFKFDLNRGPLVSSDMRFPHIPTRMSCRYWITFTPKNMVIGHGEIPGCWVVSRKDLEQAIARAKDNAIQRETAVVAAIQAREKQLRDTYDLDRDGTFSPAEKSKLIQDPKWFPSEWKNLDVNENGFLDSEDKWLVFDANENGTAEESELNAIDLATAIIAAEVFAEHDKNGDQLLDRSEMEQVTRKELTVTKSRSIYFDYQQYLRTDKNRDGKLNREELEKHFISLTRYSVARAANTGPGTAIFNVAPEHLENERFRGFLEKLWMKQKGTTAKQ